MPPVTRIYLFMTAWSGYYTYIALKLQFLSETKRQNDYVFGHKTSGILMGFVCLDHKHFRMPQASSWNVETHL